MNIPFGNAVDKVDHKANGYEVERTHSGQKRAYGDTFREFRVRTDKPIEEVERYCTENVYKCSLTREQWLVDEMAGKGADAHFRSSYNLTRTTDGEYFYQVIEPSTH